MQYPQATNQGQWLEEMAAVRAELAREANGLRLPLLARGDYVEATLRAMAYTLQYGVEVVVYIYSPHPTFCEVRFAEAGLLALIQSGSFRVLVPVASYRAGGRVNSASTVAQLDAPEVATTASPAPVAIEARTVETLGRVGAVREWMQRNGAQRIENRRDFAAAVAYGRAQAAQVDEDEDDEEPRPPYCALLGADPTAYREAQCAMFGAAADRGLPTGEAARANMIAAVGEYLGIQITSRRQLTPDEMWRVTIGIVRRHFGAGWFLNRPLRRVA